jgi:alpha-galactosidase
LKEEWLVDFSYLLGEEEYDLDTLTGGISFGEGIRTVIDKKQLLLGERIRFFAEPAPGEEGLFPVPRFLQLRLSLLPQDSLLLNGYQSWTETFERRPRDIPVRFRRIFAPVSSHYFLERYGDACLTGAGFDRGGYHGFSYALFRKGKKFLLCAGMAEEEGFSRILWKPDKRGGGNLFFQPELAESSISGVRKLMDLVLLEGSEREVFDYWDELTGSFGRITPQAAPAGGWTSWYDYYEKVTEADVLCSLASFKKLSLPVEIFQVDDGWQAAVGDWLEVKETFPRGMAPLAEEISNAGFTPGLWLAPFVAEESSALFRDHRDWFLADEDGNPVVAGHNPFNWSGHSYALNIYHPGVRSYLGSVIRTVSREWGYRLLKLDFLYAAALKPPPGKCRGAVMREAMLFLREAAGDTRILACGVPLASAAGLVEYCRVGADVALRWEDPRLRAVGYPERVSTINALRSTIGRHALDRRFFRNDPDVFILRDWNCRLSRREKQTLFLCNHIFGSLLFTSDDPGRYDEETLKLYRSAFPLREKEFLQVEVPGCSGAGYQIVFSIGACSYRALINLEPHRCHALIPPGLYYQEGSGFRHGGEVELQGRESVCFLAIDDTPWSVAGSTGQLFPGSEIDELTVSGNRITIAFSPKAVREGLLYLRAPAIAESCFVNGIEIPVEEKVDIRLAILDKSLL